MEYLSFFKRIYSLDTLDTRFAVPSTSPLRTTLNELNEDGRRQEPTKDARPSLWKTPEFYLYYVIFLIVVPLMIKAPIDVSKESHPNFKKYSRLLSPGWIPGRKVDNSDDQYQGFRENIPYLAVLVLVHPLLRRLYNSFFRTDIYTKVPSRPSRSSQLTQGLSPSAAADARLEQRVSFDLYFAFIFIIALHGFSAAKVFGILLINHRLAKKIPRKYVPLATWVFNIGILFANEFGRGYKYASIARLLSFGQAAASEKAPAAKNWGDWMDSYGGLISRWEVLFNITILRLISFNMDYYWSMQNGGKGGSSPLEKKQIDPEDLSERDRVSIPAPAEDFSLRNYFAYTLYAPLYLTGPIITFNDYVSQLRHPLPSITWERTSRYAVRFILVLLCMEVLIHFVYAVAINKADPDWGSYTPFQLSMLGFFNLHHIWLKLLIPWRFFRLWALVDGIDPPENMVRCMSNNYSALAFWRGWHRSYNRWLVRYVYVPMGGSGQKGPWGIVRSIGNFLVVFMFVAVWHDINLRLLMWGWLITLFVIPEIVATLLFPARKYQDRPDFYRRLCGVGAVGNILMMMIANLVGYAIGVEGLKGLLHGIIGSSAGVGLFAIVAGSLFVGAQVMFEHREEEKRAGIKLKC